ncbi:MAG: peptidoglycan-binding protein [Oculatellaceae cyanobacterium bins.114]|nr:peptidoglycan-binding protein [Oculatellaceae cyanobacterium bins.114]
MSPKEPNQLSFTEDSCDNIMHALSTRFLNAFISLIVSIPTVGASTLVLAQQMPSATRPNEPLLMSQAIETGVLQLQDSGSSVEQLQSQLATLGYYDGPITGFFGPLTEDAVIRFQQASGLTPDGIVGPATQTALQRSRNPQSQSFNPSTPSVVDDGLLQLDDQGDAVTALQTRLQELGYYNGPITGFFGSLTEDAVIRFQQDNGLTPDGIVGPATQSTLSRRVAPTPQATLTNPSPIRVTPLTTTSDGLLQRGDSGTAVASLQTRLRELGFYSGVSSGEFDASTEEAVRAFQRSRGLTADGVVGAQTASSLNLANIADPEGGRYSVLALQRRLRDLRLYSGPLDGRLGPETRTAIQAAQSRFNLSERDIVNGQL